MKSPLLSTNRPLYVDLPSGQCGAAPSRAFARGCEATERVSVPPPDVEGEVKDYQEQVRQMLKDLAKEKEKDAEKPLPHMKQVPEDAVWPVAGRILNPWNPGRAGFR